MKDIKFKDKIAQGINDLFYIWKREFQTTFRDQGVLIFFILVPLGYPLLYSFIYDNEVVREVPAVVVRSISFIPEPANISGRWMPHRTFRLLPIVPIWKKPSKC